MYETTLNSVKELLGDKFEKCDSPSLRLTKFVRLPEKDKKEQGIKLEEIDRACKCAKNQIEANPIVPNNAEIIYGRLLSRLIINQSGGILENAGLCLHRFFGYPMIPGSAVKGVASHAAWCEWMDASDEQKLEIAERIANVFGYPTNHEDIDDFLEKNKWEEKKCSGTVCFMDAVPQGTANLVVDVVTCHHPDYYSSEKKDEKALDNENPNPCFFPAVEKGADFKFIIVPLQHGDKSLIELAKKWLVSAICINGIGAKTAAGYGWFRDVTNEYEEKRKKEKEKQEKIEAVNKSRQEKQQKLNLIIEQIEMLGKIDVLSEKEEQQFYKLESDLDNYKELSGYQAAKDKLNVIRKRLPSNKGSFKDKLYQMSDKEILDYCVKQYQARNENDKNDIISYFMSDGNARLKKYNQGNLESNKTKNDKQKCNNGLKLINEAIKVKRKELQP